MIEISLYRLRIGSFNVSNKYHRFKKSRTSFRSLWSNKFSIDGRLIIIWIVISSVVVTYMNMCKHADEAFFFRKFYKSETSCKVLSSCDKRTTIDWLDSFLELLLINYYNRSSNCHFIREENYYVKEEVQDHNFLARYVNGNGQKKKGKESNLTYSSE